jgi:SAM-dependent methyltransferase
LSNPAVDRFVRKFVPSVAKVTYNPVLKVVVDFPDRFFGLFFAGLRKLPPNHLRMRIGVSNHIFRNQAWYINAAKDFWFFVMSRGWVDMDSTIVDIGCGCGKFAHHLRDYEFNGSAFQGKYIGIDIDQEMLDWCGHHFDHERFEFYQSTHASKVYNENGNGSLYTLPMPPDTVNFVFSSSLFTHLLEREVNNYMSESFRVLVPGGIMAMNCFLMDYPPPTMGGRHTFQHRIGEAFVESLKLPEAAVAFNSSFLLDLAAKIGFTDAKLIGSATTGKPLLACQK